MCEIETVLIFFFLLRSNICEPRSWLVFVSQEMRKRDARRKLTGHLVSALLGHEKRTPILARFSLVFFETKRYKTRMKGNDYDLPAATPHGQLEVLETRKRSMTNCPIHKVASPSA